MQNLPFLQLFVSKKIQNIPDEVPASFLLSVRRRDLLQE